MQSAVQKHKHIVLLKEEKDRFEAMRGIQKKSHAWRSWYRLTVTLGMFGLFWCVGAVFFWQAERGTVGQDYWESVYFCWVSLLSIGYGDFSPKTGAGRCFFFIWSLIAVPTMTILASDMTGTVVAFFHHYTNFIADLTILPQEALWRELLHRYPVEVFAVPKWLKKRAQEEDEASAYAGRITAEPSMTRTLDTLRSNDSVQDFKDDSYAAGIIKPDIEGIVSQHAHDVKKSPDAVALARQLALAIRRTAHDLTTEKPREYTYEEWVEFTRLIRFSAIGGPPAALQEDEEEGMIEWDWIGEDSPMMAQQNESEFVLDRLCESLVRYLKRNPPKGEFVDTLKEKGEAALKLKGGTLSDGEEAAEADSDAYTLAGSVWDSARSVKGAAHMGGALGEKDQGPMGGLHPLEETDHEHEHHGIMPIKKE